MHEIRMKHVFRAPYVFRGSILPRLTGNQLGAAPEGYLSGARSDAAGNILQSLIDWQGRKISVCNQS
jgi:hypothetical protein